VHVTQALRERDQSRAMARLSVLAEGFGGGTRIAACLKFFNDRHAKETLTSRSVVSRQPSGLSQMRRRARRFKTAVQPSAPPAHPCHNRRS
jgi:uncharacterized protein with von Willebrand factor type A (vWA) domain